jgi:hypothetical protein
MFAMEHPVAAFSHKSSLNVTELSDYITRRKKKKKSQYLKDVKMVVHFLGYTL